MNKRILFLVVAVLSLSGLAQQQQAGGQNEAPSSTTFRSNVHLVVLDVVALDDHGHPAADLNRDDFVVLEDGKPQEIKQFEKSMASSAPLELSKPLAPNEFRNVPAQVPNAVNVVLLDMLNTPTRDQGEARRHLLSFLRGMPKGRQVALYSLDTKLHLIQDFTGNSDTLIAAAERAQVRPSALQQSTADQNGDGELVDTISKLGPIAGNAAARIQSFVKNTDTGKTDMRVGLTLQSLQQLARTLAGVPGRKNLIWLSGGFPLNLEENFNDAQQSVSTAARSYHDAVEQTSAVLAQAQIAVYPVDVLGVVVGGVDVTVGGRGMFDADRSGTIGDVMSQQTTQYSAVHNSMDLMAKNTGGQAFYNGNDLKDAIGRSMDLGSSYYTLTYNPTNSEWNGVLRKIEVKTPGKKVKLTYRRSYYAVPDKRYALPDLEKMLVASMDPEMADSTMLSVGVKILPGTKGPNSVVLEYDLDRTQFEFVEAEKQKVAMIDLAIESWDKKGKASGRFGQSVKIPADATHSKVGFRQEMVLQPNTALVRIGVLDRSSGRIGTVEVSSLPIAADTQGKADTKPETKP